MASNMQLSPIFLFIFIVFSSLMVNLSSCFNPKHLNASLANADGFAPALATWYGDATGGGSGAACGFGDDVTSPPFSAMTSAGNSKIFLGGKGCGNCYQVKCTQAPYCSGNAITITVTNQCPGACDAVPYHFDLSGTAFGAMAHPGQGDNLRKLGQVDVQFTRVSCNYGSSKIAFKIDPNASQFWFATAIEYMDGDGGLSAVEISWGGGSFSPMKNIWGAVWQADINASMRGPFSFKLTSGVGKVLVASNVVPQGFTPGNTYWSNDNF